MTAQSYNMPMESVVHAAQTACVMGSGLEGVSGRAVPLPDQDSVLRKTKRISCQSSKHKMRVVSEQIRVRFQVEHAKRLQSLPPKERERAVAVALGAKLEGIDLQKLLESSQELHRVRHVLIGIFEFASVNGIALDVRKIEDAVARIGKILGGGVHP